MFPVAPSIRYQISEPAGERASDASGNGRVCMAHLQQLTPIIAGGPMCRYRAASDVGGSATELLIWVGTAAKARTRLLQLHQMWSIRGLLLPWRSERYSQLSHLPIPFLSTSLRYLRCRL